MKNIIQKTILFSISLLVSVTLFTPVKSLALDNVETIRLNLAIKDQIQFEQCVLKDPIVNRDDVLGIVNVMIPKDQIEERKTYYLNCGGVVEAYLDNFSEKTVVPVDPSYATYQYNLKRIGLESAWTTTKGSASVIVAVIDTGVDASGVLSDFGAGTILPGAAIITSGTTGNQSTYIDSYVGQYSYDGGSHGTAVAMTIAAAMNSKSITGVAPNVKILPIKVFRDEKTLNENVVAYNQDVAKGIVMAVDKGAKIINLSLGSYYSDYALMTAVQYAITHDVIVVAASGNSSDHMGLDTCMFCSAYDGQITYPANYEEVIAVGSISKANLLSNFSNYSGGTLDIVAYGEDIWLPWRKENAYKLLDGTSFSSPTVAGALALVISAYPNLTPLQARAALMRGATDITAYQVGWDSETGYGLVNAAKALSFAAEITQKDDHDDTYAKSTKVEFLSPVSSGLTYVGDRDLYCITTYKTENLRFEVTTTQPINIYTQMYRLIENGSLQIMTSLRSPWVRISNVPAGTYCGAVSEPDGRTTPEGALYTAGFTSDILISSPMITATSTNGVIKSGETSFSPLTLKIEDSFKHEITLTKNGVPFVLPSNGVLNEDGDYVLVVDDVKNDPVIFSFKIQTAINLTGFLDGRLYRNDITIRFSADSATINGEPLSSGTTISQDGTYVLEFHLGEQIYTASFSIDKTPPVVTGVYQVNLFRTKPITFNEGTALLDGRPFINGTVVSNLGNHTLAVTDAAGNQTYRFFEIIDKITISPLTVNPGPDSIKINISYGGYALFYRAYSVDLITNERTFLAEFTSPFYTVTNLTQLNKTYKFQVEGCRTVENETLCSSPQEITAKTMLDYVKFVGNQTNYKSVSLSWSANPLATGYDIVVNGTVLASTTDLSIDLVLPEPESLYTNWDINVVATIMIDGVKIQGLYDITSRRSFGVITPNPKNVKITAQDDGSYRISWDPVSGAAKYRISGVDSTKNPIFQTTVNAPYYDTTIWTANDVLVVQVTAITVLANGHEKNSDGVYSSVIKTNPATPVLSGSSSGADSVTLSWTGDAKDSGYVVYELNPLTSQYEVIIDDTQSTSVTFTGKSIGEVSIYKVRAFRVDENVRVYGAFSSEAALTPTPLSVTGFKAVSIGADHAQFAWDRQSGVTHYEIYTATSLAGVYTLKATLPSDSDGMVSGLLFNTTTYFKIKPIVITSSQSFSGPLSSAIVAKTALESVPNFTVIPQGYNANGLSWKAVELATGYEIYMSTGSSGTYALLTSTTALGFTHGALLTNTKYNYRVRPYRLVGTVRVYGAFSPIVSATPLPTAPKVAVVSAGYNSFSLSWPLVAGANGYEIYYSLSAEGTYLKLASQTANSILAKGFLTDTTYYFKVRAYRLVNTVPVFGEYSVMAYGKAIPSTPVLSASSAGYTSATLTWPAVAGATGYEVYHQSSGQPEFSLVADTALLSQSITTLVTGSINNFKVKAYRLVGEVKVYSLDSAVKSVIPVPSNLTMAKVINPKYTELSVIWNEVSGATGYEIFRSNSTTGTFISLAHVEGSLTYVNTGLAFNTSYYYKIRPYTTVDSVKIYGNLTIAISGRTALETVSAPKAAYVSYNANTISWSAVTGATGYEIYRSTGTSTTYALLVSTTGLSYTNNALLTATRYNYRIRAYRLVGTVKVYGAFSSTVTATPLPWTPSVSVASSGYNSFNLSWPLIAGANGYEVSYSLSETGSFIKLLTVTSPGASIRGFVTDTRYYFRVRAYRLVNTIPVYGAYSLIVSGKPIPSSPVLTATSSGFNSVNLSWLAVTGASGYEIFMQQPVTSEYEMIADTPLLTTIVSSMITGSPVNFKMRAYRLVNDIKVYSLDSGVKTATPIPSLVPGFKVALPSISSLKLSWTAVAGASGYEVLKSSSASGTYVSLGLVEGSTEINVTGLSFNTTTYYKIRAFTKVEETIVYGPTSASLAALTTPSPVTLKVTNASYSSNSLSWDPIEGASGYEIYYSSGTTSTTTLLKTLTATNFAHTTLLYNTQYNYKVRAYRLVGTLKVYGPFSTLISTKTLPSAPKALLASTHDSITLNWNSVEIAQGYEISIATQEQGPYTAVSQTTLSKTFTNLTTGTTYYFKLRSYRWSSTTKVYSLYSPILTVTPSLEAPVIQLSDFSMTQATISWAAVPGASDYEVRWISDLPEAQWLTDSVSALSFTLSDLDPMLHYTVEVIAIKKINELPVLSLPSNQLIFSYSETQ